MPTVAAMLSVYFSVGMMLGLAMWWTVGRNEDDDVDDLLAAAVVVFLIAFLWPGVLMLWAWFEVARRKEKP